MPNSCQGAAERLSLWLLSTVQHAKHTQHVTVLCSLNLIERPLSYWMNDNSAPLGERHVNILWAGLGARRQEQNQRLMATLLPELLA